MTSSRKLFIIFLSFTFLLSACSPATNSITSTPRPTSAAATKPSEAKTPTPAVSSLRVSREALRGVQVTVWHPWFDAEASPFESLVSTFNNTNEWGIVVNAVSQQNFNELYLQTTAALEEESHPQVVIALPEYALGWDNVVDLNTYLNDPEYGLSALEISDFANAVWMQDEVDGIRYALPAQRTARFMLYNQTWARELGFISPPQTSSDFETQACAAHAALGRDGDPNNDALGGWLIDAHPVTPLAWMLSFDGGIQEENGYRFLTQGNIDALKFLKVLQQDSCAWVASPDLPVADRFAARQALFVNASLEEFSDQARAFFTADSRDEWTALAFPGAEKQTVVSYGSSFVMFESDDATQLASWLFMRWMISPDVQARWIQSTGLLPLRTATLDLLGDYSASHPQWAEAVELLPVAMTTPKLASWRVVRVMLGDAFADMFDTIRHPDLTDGQVPAILRQMEDTANELNR